MQQYLALLNDHMVWGQTFIQQHQHWAAPIAFLLAFVKSLPLVPLLIPGTALLLTIGSLIGTSEISFIPIWIAISLGAALGDWLSYGLGLHFADSVRQSRLATRYPDLLPRGEAFFHRWGAFSIVLCRFFGPLRATVPLISGIFAMPILTFQIANWLSAFLWAAALLAPGALALPYLLRL